MKTKLNKFSSRAFYLVDCAKEFLQTDPKKAEESFQESAELFEKVAGCEKHAAKSYFSLKKYEKAKPLFVIAKEYAEAGESIMQILCEKPEHPNKMDLYKEALNYFDKVEKYGKVLECCEIIKDYKKTMKFLKKYEKYIGNFVAMLETNLKKYMEELETTLQNICNYIV